MTKQTAIDAPPRDGAFTQILAGYESGVLLDELGAAIRAATEAATLTGKPAKVSLELTITISGNAIAVKPKVVEKLPKVEPLAAIFFADEDFNLVRNDPRQRELVLRTVENKQAMQRDEESLRKASAV